MKNLNLTIDEIDEINEVLNEKNFETLKERKERKERKKTKRIEIRGYFNEKLNQKKFDIEIQRYWGRTVAMNVPCLQYNVSKFEFRVTKKKGFYKLKVYRTTGMYYCNYKRIYKNLLFTELKEIMGYYAQESLQECKFLEEKGYPLERYVGIFF